MKDPITLATTPHEDRRGTPDSNAPDAPDAPNTQRMRTLLDAAATCRPLEEVTALVSLLKEGDGRLPDAGHEALRTAAVTRPVQDVQRMVALLGESPHEVVEADITLRAAAVGRSIEDVALLVTSLGKDETGAADRQRRAGPSEQDDEERYHEPDEEPYDERFEEPYELPYTELSDAPYQDRQQDRHPVRQQDRHPVRQQDPRRRAAPVAAPAGSPALRHVLRWPVALALLVSGALHLPNDLTALPSAAPADFLPLLVALLCLGVGALVALRDTPGVWRAGAVTGTGVVALHVLGGSAGFDPLAGAVGSTLAWAGVTVVLCAAAGAVLAGLALRNRQENSA
ncbi:hypothetical protein [Streptomyces sp. NRRL F-2580]|uniref:hypothetical protein n=1 Tax=Streptomyces sp. NRRL F-2580 TaxID=1463841 RepID=UPI0004C758E7|nr:hypothetical protein [Streptomyces sp. NRRL F-2580]